jgi:hypothetical protein
MRGPMCFPRATIGVRIRIRQAPRADRRTVCVARYRVSLTIDV